MALQFDGNIVAASENDRRFGLTRYGADGALDRPSARRASSLDRVAEASGFPSGLALQTDGQIVIAGNDGVARYRPNGTPDAAFGINGVARTNILIDAVRPSARRADSDRWNSAQQLCAQPLRRRVSDHDRRCAYPRRGLRKDGNRQRNAGTQTGRSCRQGHPARLLRLPHTRRRNHDDGRGWLVARSCQPQESGRCKGDGGRRGESPARRAGAPEANAHALLAYTRCGLAVVAGRSLADWTVVLQRFARGRWVDGRRVTLRRIARRGSTVISGATFRARAGKQRLRLLLRPQHLRLLRELSQPGDQGASGLENPASGFREQIRLDKAVEVAVQDPLDVPDLVLGAVILHQLVRVDDVAADLHSPRSPCSRAAALLGHLRIPLLLERARPGASGGSASPSPCSSDWERSFWTLTTRPEGRCVSRTAESVLFTCWPPAPLAR